MNLQSRLYLAIEAIEAIEATRFEARASGVDVSVSTLPPATSEGPGPLRRKQKQNTFLPLEGPGGPNRATLGGDAPPG